MKRIIPFSKYFIPATALSLILMGLGVVGYFVLHFNLGVDFQAGLIQEIQFAPTAFRLTYSGQGNASISLSRSSLDVVISGAAVDETTHRFAFNTYTTQGALIRGLKEIEGIGVTDSASASASSAWLIQSAQSNPKLEANNPFTVHYLPPNADPVRIEDVRASLLPLGTVSVQILGAPSDRRFMIRMEDADISSGKGVPAEKILLTLENSFGKGEVAVTRSDYVGSRFSKQLSDQAGGLLAMTLVIILIYCSFRFKFQFALGAVLAIMHDAIIVVTYIVWSRMEFNTITIAALMTVMGYSINDTIVVFDRMKETRRIYPDDSFVQVLDRAVTECLSRTFITTLTTMIAVAFLYIFTTGSMRDFALCLLIGMTAGVYSTIFIASGIAYFWEIMASKRQQRKKLKAARAGA